jgi:acyl-CoA reductase-like NAD-dependent aldehyde dehydrogenase
MFTAGVDCGCGLVDEEQFGLVPPIIRYHDPEEVIREANANSVGLGGSASIRNAGVAKRIAYRLEAGPVWINKHDAIQSKAPFGGVNQSRVGLEFRNDGPKEFTSIQTVLC